MRKLIFITVFVFIHIQFGFAQQIKGNYAIKNVQNGMLLRVKDASNKNGTPLVAYNPQNWKCMTWDFIQVSEGTYQMKNLLTNKTFQPKDGKIESSTLEEQPLNSGDANQQYVFESLGKNVYLIKLIGTELYLTPSDEKGTTNSAIFLAKKLSSKLQQWIIYKQSPNM